MADKSLTIVAPTAATPGVRVMLDRTPNGISATIFYDPGAGLPIQTAHYSEAEVAGAPAAVTSAIATLFNAVMAANVAPARMGF